MKVPKYEIVKKELLAYIKRMPPEQEYLPYENELQNLFNVSKRTVRRALLDLREEGLIDTGRKRGSKVIRRKLDSSPRTNRISTERSLVNASVASLFLSDKDGKTPTEFLPWRITSELEKTAMNEGGQLITCNLRDPRWQNIDDVVQVLVDNRVECAFCHFHEKMRNKIKFHQFAEKKIKLIIYYADWRSFESSLHDIRPSVDWIFPNHRNGIYDLLVKEFSDVDYIAYIGGKFESSWEAERAEAIRMFAEERGIQSDILLEDISEEMNNATPHEPSSYERARFKTGTLAISKIIDDLDRRQRPLLIGANDDYASGVAHGIEKSHLTMPNDVELIGYDNSPLAMQENLSSFYVDHVSIANAIVKLWKQYHADKTAGLLQSTGAIVFPSLQKRLTTR